MLRMSSVALNVLVKLSEAGKSFVKKGPADPIAFPVRLLIQKRFGLRMKVSK